MKPIFAKKTFSSWHFGCFTKNQATIQESDIWQISDRRKLSVVFCVAAELISQNYQIWGKKSMLSQLFSQSQYWFCKGGQLPNDNPTGFSHFQKIKKTWNNLRI